MTRDTFDEHASELMSKIGEAIKSLAMFLVIFALTALLVLTRVLPYALRAVSILAWACGLFVEFVAVQTLYARMGDLIAAFLTAAMATVIVAVLPMAFTSLGDYMWGGYAFAAAIAFGVAFTADRTPESIYPLASALPPVLACMGILMVAIKRGEGHARKLESVR